MNRFDTRIACWTIAVTLLLCLLLTAAGVWLLGIGWKFVGVLCILMTLCIVIHIVIARWQDRKR